MQECDFLNLTEPEQRAFRPHKAPLAIGAIISVMLLAAFNILPIAALALLAAILVILARCLDLEEAYEAIEWPILFIIFGMLALGRAMESTAAASLVAAGRYRFIDFPRVGAPLNFILWIAASLLIPIFWPFVAKP